MTAEEFLANTVESLHLGCNADKLAVITLLNADFIAASCA